jgi:hypothetical protein
MATVVLASTWLAAHRAERSAAAEPAAPAAKGPSAKSASPLHVVVRERTEKPLLISDQPWEDYCIAYANVIREGDMWRMWYTAFDHTYRDDRDSCFCYAFSHDGVHWEKPNLGMKDYDGNRDNNILVLGKAVGGLHGQSVFVDPAAPAVERVKMVYSTLVDSKWAVFGAHSAEGIGWFFDKRPLLAFNSDTQTVCIPDGKLYRLYVRMWTGGDFKGLRSVGYSESSTFSNFKPPVQILAPDAADPPNTDLYNNAVTRLSADRYLMFPSAFQHGKVEDGKDTVVPHLAQSRDGRHFTRVGREPLLALGQGFDSKGIYVCPGAVPGERPGTWWFYYLGTDVGHDQGTPDKTHHAGGIGRFLLSVE